MNNYTEFLRQKIKMANFAGFDVQPSDLSPILYPHQRDIVKHREKIAASNRTGAWFGCMRCGAQFWRKRYAILKGQNKFCGRSCSNKHNQGGWHVAS